MAVSLADALGQVPLEVGRTYHCRVGSLRVEVRVEENAAGVRPAAIRDSDVMLDPWIDLPAPPVMTLLQVSTGAPVLPDLPLIQDDARNGA